jgi:hypothetical protein
MTYKPPAVLGRTFLDLVEVAKQMNINDFFAPIEMLPEALAWMSQTKGSLKLDDNGRLIIHWYDEVTV